MGGWVGVYMLEWGNVAIGSDQCKEETPSTLGMGSENGTGLSRTSTACSGALASWIATVGWL